LFGIPQYGTGRKLIGEIVYMTYNDEESGCDNYDYNPPKSGETTIFLIDRGDCTFVQKLRMAQSKGASAVIIADNVCQCSNIDAPTEVKGRTQKFKNVCYKLAEEAQKAGRLLPIDICENSLPFMADDGTGGDILIPSFLIDFYDAQRFKDCYLTANPSIGGEKYESITGYTCDIGSKLVASMEWTLPAPDNNVEYDIWTSSDSEAKFKKDFQNIATLLKDSTTFTPHYFVWDGTKWGCTVTNNPCRSQCTDGGYYCNPDPDNDIFAGLSGKDIVEENLRQLCVWKQAQPFLRQNGAELWWKYVIEFARRCHPGSTPTTDKFNERCSEETHKNVTGLSWEKTKQCVRESWDQGKLRNKILDAEIAARTLKNILQLPTLVVNNITIRGGVTSASVLAAICAGFEKDTEPYMCECVNKAAPGKLQECVASLCTSGNKYCFLDSHCYPSDEFSARCSQTCPNGFVFCKSQGLCKPTIQDCQSCHDPALPFYCSSMSACVATLEGCGKGISLGQLIGILVVVVIAAGGVVVYYWRRQRAKMQEEMRSILSEYMPLEDVNSGNRGLSSIPSRPLGFTSNSESQVQNNSVELSKADDTSKKDTNSLGLV